MIYSFLGGFAKGFKHFLELALGTYIFNLLLKADLTR